MCHAILNKIKYYPLSKDFVHLYRILSVGAYMKFVWETPEEINMALAQRLSRIRKRRNLSQQALAEKSNVSFGSIKLFETTGQISLISLTKLCVALDCVDEIKNLFTNVEYSSIEEVLRERT